MSRLVTVILVIGLGLGLQGCFSLAGTGVGAAARNIDPKPPKAETASTCQSWECWDGYACGPCQEASTTDKPSKSK